MEKHDILLLTETHQSPERGLPRVEGYHWESAYRKTTRQSTARGSGGIAMLLRKELQGRVQVMARDPEARYMWVRLQLSEAQVLYIAICYFSPKGSIYATLGEEERVDSNGREEEETAPAIGVSPYLALSEDITHYSTLGEVLLMGDFNARTQSRQCDIYDMEDPEMMLAKEAEDTGTIRLSDDTGADSTRYGHHLLELGARHHLVIYNGMTQWPGSGALTCFPLGGGGSTVDYVLGSRETTQVVTSFTVPHCPIGADHTYLSLSLAGPSYTPTPPRITAHTTVYFTHDLADIYEHHIYDGLIQMDPTAPMSTLTTQLSSLLHTAATNSFPHHTHTGHTSRPGTMPQNRWYDDECRELYRHLRTQQTLGRITQRETRRQMRSLTRRKRRAYEETQYWDLYHLLMSRDTATAWRRIREPRPSTPIEDPHIWHTYVKSLYHVPHQPPIPQPSTSRPTTSTFFTESMVKRAIRRLQHGRSSDHTGIQSEHIIYAADTLAPFIAHLFNRALAEGLPAEWTMHTIAPIHKAGDMTDPGNYRTIMIGHTLAKLYGAVLEAELSTYAERERLRAPGQAGFRRDFSTIDHIFILRCLIDQAKARKRRLYCCFVDFRKAFDTVPRERLFQRLQSLGIPTEMVWGIYALYEQVMGRVRCPGGLSETIASTIGVKQGCPLSPTLFGLYIDEVADFILHRGGSGVDISGIPVHIMLYADDIILVSESQEGLQLHLEGLDDFCTQKGLSVNLGKTKAMIFHTSGQVRRQTIFTLAGGQVEVVDSYVYLGITFASTAGRFSMIRAATDRLTRGYAALAMLERQCHQAHFQEPRTKGWLFDTLVTPALMYAAAVWAPGLSDSSWTQIERPQVLMLSRMIRSKPSVPHDIIRAEFAAPPMLVEALFQVICFIHRMRDMDPDRLSHRAFEASRQLAEAGDTGSWYAQMIQLLTRCGWDIDHLPPLQYDHDLDAPHRKLSHSERNRVMRQDLLQRYMMRTWVTPHQSLPTKMSYYRDWFLNISEDGFIQRPRYMDVYMSHSARVAIGQLRVSSHQLEIEVGRAARVNRAERICRLCQEGVESEEHYVCRCRAYSDIRDRYTTIFSGEPSLRQIMESADQRRFGQFLLEIQRHRDTLLQVHTIGRGGRQLQLTDFFQRSSPVLTRIQEGVTLQRAEELRAKRRPRARGYQTPRLHQGEITAIRTRHQLHIQERLAHLHSHPEIMFQGISTSPSPMYHILHPYYGTGWS